MGPRDFEDSWERGGDARNGWECRMLALTYLHRDSQIFRNLRFTFSMAAINQSDSSYTTPFLTSTTIQLTATTKLTCQKNRVKQTVIAPSKASSSNNFFLFPSSFAPHISHPTFSFPRKLLLHSNTNPTTQTTTASTTPSLPTPAATPPLCPCAPVVAAATAAVADALPI